MLSSLTCTNHRSYAERSKIQNLAWTLNRVLLATSGRIITCPTRRTEKIPHQGSGADRITPLLNTMNTILQKTVFRNIATDTRTIEECDLFVALDGPNFDGASFVYEAVDKGAAGILVAESKVEETLHSLKEHPLPGSLPSLPIIVVKDSLHALGNLASYRRYLLPKTKVIAVTGSSGKTTVKEMTAAIISGSFNTYKSKGNFNNLIGVPLSILELERHHEFAVLEMGMNRPGEISRLTDMADPDIGCIVNIQEAHLAGLESLLGVARAKNELFNGMKSWSTLVVNLDDPMVRAMAKSHRMKKITYAVTAKGRRHNPYIKATHIKNLGESGMSFTLQIGKHKSRVSIRAIGFHNVANAVTAAALAHAAGVDMAEIISGLEIFEPIEKRAQILLLPSLGLKVLNDSYNANPSSMLAALKTVTGLKQEKRVIAVLGDMLEMGDKSIQAHQLLGKTVADLNIDYLAATGEFAAEVVTSAKKSGMPAENARQFSLKREIASWVRQLVADGKLTTNDWLLVKGSRGMKMELVIERLEYEDHGKQSAADHD